MPILTLCRGSHAEADSEPRTPAFQRFACGVGHVLNDIIRQLLFSFRLVFLMQVLGLSAVNAGWLILQKQLANAVISPFAAFLVDRIDIPFLSWKLGRRKSWHLIGTVLGTIFTPLLFSACFPCHSDGVQWQLMIYVSILSTILALADCLLNIGQLSLIPIIAKNQSEAVELNTWRTFFTFLSGIVAYLVAWAIFGQDSSDHLSAESSMDFTVMTLILVGIGLVFALIFHVGTKESLCEGDKTLSVMVTKCVRKTSFIPSSTLQSLQLQSKSYLRADVHCKKERIRDAFINSLRAKEEPVTGGFPRRFIDALLTVDEDKDDKANVEISFKKEDGIKTVSKFLKIGVQSLITAQAYDEMLTYIKGLPREGKISVLMSVIKELAGVDTNKEKTEAESHEKYFQAGSLASTESFGVDNKGYDCCATESKPCCPGQITDAKMVTEVSPHNVTSHTLDVNYSSSSKAMMNSKPFIVSDDPESVLPVTPTPKTVRNWLKDPHLYMVAIIYACTVVLRNVCYAYLPLFLIYRLQLGKDAIAYVPLIMLVSAALSSALSKRLVGIVGSKWSFILAALLVIGANLWFYFITRSNKVMIYPAVVLLGFGLSTTIINALSFAAELIGDNKSTSGFVFAFMSSMSYITGAALVIAIQKSFPHGSNSEVCEECGDYVRHVFSLVPSSLAVISGLVVMLLQSLQTIHKGNVLQRNSSLELKAESQSERTFSRD